MTLRVCDCRLFLDACCPYPEKLRSPGITGEAFHLAYAHVPHTCYTFDAIGFTALFALILFLLITRRIDAKSSPDG